MSSFHAKFQGLSFTKARHHATKKVLEIGDIREGKGYCGVAHVHDIYWSGQNVVKASVDMYVTPFEETNPVARRTGQFFFPY